MRQRHIFKFGRSTQINSAPRNRICPLPRVHTYACLFFGALPLRFFFVKNGIFRLVGPPDLTLVMPQLNCFWFARATLCHLVWKSLYLPWCLQSCLCKKAYICFWKGTWHSRKIQVNQQYSFVSNAEVRIEDDVIDVKKKRKYWDQRNKLNQASGCANFVNKQTESLFRGT